MVAAALAGVVVIGAILTSGPSSEAILPPGTGGTIGGSLSDGDTSSLVATPGGTDDHVPPLQADDDAPPKTDAAPSSDGDVSADHSDAPPNEDDAPAGNGDAHTSDDLAETDGGPPPGWSEAARGFGLAFTRTGVGHDAWFTTMSSWLTPEQAAAYRDVPIEAIPIGNLVRVDVADPAPAVHALGTLTYDTGMVLAVGLSYRADAGSWLVARVELADAGAG
ncbi:hypothetical protein [Jiangella muralis]|uniref:hypothetical protein n=1 Tax=Jiangella muralis TaxID=702383 RepID=UPI0012F7CEEB|nr:hypothetical protein [Jiangella muralis]